MAGENRWEHYGFEEIIRAILQEVHYADPEHHFGRPFLTAYQVAVAFAQRAPEVVEALDLKIGGKGTGKHVSLAQYIAQRLSAKIKDGSIIDIEGAFLSNNNLKEISFNNAGTTITSSLTGGDYDVSMFRLRTK